MSDSFDVTTVIFALLALFVLFKLKTVLGTRTGSTKPPPDSHSQQKNEERIANSDVPENVVQLPGTSSQPDSIPPETSRGTWEKYAEPQGWDGLESIAAADSGFQMLSFVSGSKAAYEMIVLAFAGGDLKTLRELLANEVYDGFASAISTRESRGEKIETSFVSIEKAMIIDAQIKNDIAQITIRFASKLITSTRDKSGSIIDGNADKVIDITDVWTFSRNARSKDPNWKLIATEAAH